MLSRGLLISIGVTVLAVGLLFVYFRNKISSMEKKVELMFNLIQNYETQTQSNIMQAQNMMMHREVPMPNMESNNLIDVSDDEDSEEVSDSDNDSEEEEETLSFENTTDTQETKTVELDTLDITNLDSVLGNIEENKNNDVQNLDKDTDSLDEEDSDSEEEDEEEEEEEEEEELHLEAEQLKELTEDEYKKKTVAELKKIAESRGLVNYKSLKKNPLIQLLMKPSK